jgi:hypothetical protein
VTSGDGNDGRGRGRREVRVHRYRVIVDSSPPSHPHRKEEKINGRSLTTELLFTSDEVSGGPEEVV